LLWQRGRADPQIWYTLSTDGEWSGPSPIAGDSSGGRSPFVVPIDSGFGAVWEYSGRIVFAEFDSGTWSSPEFVTPAGDTGNSSPVLRYLGYRPWVIWTKVKPEGNEHAIKHSLYMDKLWSLPDTVAEAGDNQRPRVDKPGFRYMNASVSYESNITGDWEIYGRTADGASGSLHWNGQAENVSNNPLADDRFASFIDIPIVTVNRTAQSWFYFFAGTWVVQSTTGDSILVTSGPYDRSYRTVAPGTVSRNPDLSCGLGYSSVRVWSVWENNATGVWKLYGTRADIVVDVDPEEPMPTSFRLDQNYPNPFNPSTTITFSIPGGREYAVGGMETKLVVYDLLGREVAVLVNEKKEAGVYEVRLDGSHLASGVYLYRIVAGSFTETKRLVLIR
jgi:hypothetical protein